MEEKEDQIRQRRKTLEFIEYLFQHYKYTRQTGHTMLLVQGAQNYAGQFFLIAHNEKYGNELKKQHKLLNAHIISRENARDFSRGTDYPVIFDNAVLTNIFDDIYWLTRSQENEIIQFERAQRRLAKYIEITADGSADSGFVVDKTIEHIKLRYADIIELNSDIKGLKSKMEQYENSINLLKNFLEVRSPQPFHPIVQNPRSITSMAMSVIQGQREIMTAQSKELDTIKNKWWYRFFTMFSK